MSTLWRLFLRDDGKFPPFDMRRWRLESIAAGDTIHGGGTFPILAYSSSISRFCTACRDWTSHRCLRERGGFSEKLGLPVWLRQKCIQCCNHDYIKGLYVRILMYQSLFFIGNVWTACNETWKTRSSLTVDWFLWEELLGKIQKDVSEPLFRSLTHKN